MHGLPKFQKFKKPRPTLIPFASILLPLQAADRMLLVVIIQDPKHSLRHGYMKTCGIERIELRAGVAVDRVTAMVLEVSSFILGVLT